MGIIHQTTQAFNTCSHLGFGGVTKPDNDSVYKNGTDFTRKSNEKPNSNAFKKNE
jgi:hypothetical protein